MMYENHEPDGNNTIRVSRIVCDFIVLVVVAVPLLIFHEWVHPFKRGFYCDDETIRYPYLESTVTRQMLIVVGLLVSFMLILGTEVFRTLAWEKKCENQFKTYRFRSHSVHRFIVRLYCFIGYFLVGVCFNQLMVDIAKYTIGRQRPHFMSVCKPSVGFDSCTTPDAYIVDYTCTGTDKKLVHESQLSFYSGHAAFSFYVAWFIGLYLQARLFRPLFSRLLLPVIQFLLFGGAAYVSLTRISDYKHHWSDVLVGAIMGSSIGIFVALYVAEVFKRREIPEVPAARNEFGLIRMEKKPEMIVLSSAGGNGGNASGNVLSSQSVVVSNEVDPASQRLSRGTSFGDAISFYSALTDWDATSAGALSGRTEFLSMHSNPSWVSLSSDGRPARL